MARHFLFSSPIPRGPFSIDLGISETPSNMRSIQPGPELVSSSGNWEIGDALCTLLLRMTLSGEDVPTPNTFRAISHQNPQEDVALSYDPTSTLWPPPHIHSSSTWSIFNRTDAHLLPPLKAGTVESNASVPATVPVPPPSHPSQVLPDTPFSPHLEPHWSIFIKALKSSTENGRHRVSDVTESEVLADMLENMQVAKGVVT
jgi:hypothetical protein